VYIFQIVFCFSSRPKSFCWEHSVQFKTKVPRYMPTWLPRTYLSWDELFGQWNRTSDPNPLPMFPVSVSPNLLERTSNNLERINHESYQFYSDLRSKFIVKIIWWMLVIALLGSYIIITCGGIALHFFVEAIGCAFRYVNLLVTELQFIQNRSSIWHAVISWNI